jgi:hypothetical protein
VWRRLSTKAVQVGTYDGLGNGPFGAPLEKVLDSQSLITHLIDVFDSLLSYVPNCSKRWEADGHTVGPHYSHCLRFPVEPGEVRHTQRPVWAIYTVQPVVLTLSTKSSTMLPRQDSLVVR